MAIDNISDVNMNRRLFKTAIEKYAKTRKLFKQLEEAGLVSGNDNHIGDIGEYYVYRYLLKSDLNTRLAPKKNSLHDIEISNNEKVSVKTITTWSKRGKGTQIKIDDVDDRNWDYLFAVYLDDNLKPVKIAKIRFDELISKREFVENKRRREQDGTKAHPRFQWWSWLEDYLLTEDEIRSLF